MFTSITIRLLLAIILAGGLASGQSRIVLQQDQQRLLNFSSSLAPALSSLAVTDSVTTTQQRASRKEQPLPRFYAHIFGGVGFSFLGAKEISRLLGDEFGIGIGLPAWSYGVRGGLGKFFQVEYNIGESAHDFNNNSIVPGIPSEVIKMDYDTKDVQFKVNIAFWDNTRNRAGRAQVFFLLAGFGDVEWRDETGDGFKGRSNVFGIEYGVLSKNATFSASFKRYGITFEETTLLGTVFDVETDASDWIMEMKVGFGLGI